MNIQVKRSAKAYSRATILIEAPAVIVFKIISEINNWKLWQSSVEKAGIEGETINGKSFTWKTGGVNIVSTLHTVEPFAEIGWTGKFYEPMALVVGGHKLFFYPNFGCHVERKPGFTRATFDQFFTIFPRPSLFCFCNFT